MVQEDKMNARLGVKVSIIVPVFNTERYLEMCLGSLVNQSLSEIEIICIDDGSTDASWSIIQSFAKRDGRVIAIRQENNGPAIARNQGLQVAKGEYIGFVDSDDYVDNNYYEELYGTATKDNADIARAYVKVESYDKKDHDNKRFEDYLNVDLKKQIEINKLNQKHSVWLAIFRRDFIKRHSISFPEHIVAGEDSLFCIETSYYANKIIYAQEITKYHYRVSRPGSIMTSFLHTDEGLLTRAVVVRETIKSLNNKPNYDKGVYINRVADTTLMACSLFVGAGLQTKKRASRIMAESWKAAKHKKEILDEIGRRNQDYADMMGRNFKGLWYTGKMMQSRLSKLRKSGKRGVKALLPYGAVVTYKRYKDSKKLNYCPICEQRSEFLPMKSTGGTRHKAACPNCYSLERHRLTWLFITRKIGLDGLKGKSMLHVAAEPSFGPKLRGVVGEKYITADLLEKADVKMDITNIKKADNSYDYIICNHVLEHVDDDVKAMKELRRVQKKNGWSILLVPVADMPTTYEDKKIKSKEGRLEAFGQEDHVRKYGSDYTDRLKSSGYKLKTYHAKDIATRREIQDMSLVEDSKLWGFISTEIYFCTK